MSIVTRGLGDPQGIVTRGLGAGISTLSGRGGVIILPDEISTTDIGIIEDLVTAVEVALAPVVEELLTEEGLEILLTSTSTLAVGCSEASVTGVALAAEALAVAGGETGVTAVGSSEAGIVDVTAAEAEVVEDTSSEGEQTIISTDERNAGD